jgi:hypothetical protein
MTVESHLAELKRRHNDIDRQLDEAKLHPSIDDLEIATLKRKKLMLKDEIEKLKGDAEVH